MDLPDQITLPDYVWWSEISVRILFGPVRGPKLIVVGNFET